METIGFIVVVIIALHIIFFISSVFLHLFSSKYKNKLKEDATIDRMYMEDVQKKWAEIREQNSSDV